MSIARKLFALGVCAVIYYILMGGVTTFWMEQQQPSLPTTQNDDDGSDVSGHSSHNRGGSLIDADVESGSPGRRRNLHQVVPLSLGGGASESPDNASQWLPTGAKLFCPSFDNESYMWLKPEQPFANEVSLFHVHINECPAPVVFYHIPHFPSALKAPVTLRRKQMRAYFRHHDKSSGHHDDIFSPSLNFTAGFSTSATPQSSRSALFVFDTFLWRSIREVTATSLLDCPKRVSSRDDTVETCPAHTRQCVRHCLQSLCCTGIQIVNSATHRQCDLIAARLDETRSDAPYPLTKKPLFLLAQRREFRPSLNTDHLRLVVLSGPQTTMRLYGDRQGRRELLGGGSAMVVALHGIFGSTSSSATYSQSMSGKPLKVTMVIVDDKSGFDVASGWFGQTDASIREQVQTLIMAKGLREDSHDNSTTTIVMTPSVQGLKIVLGSDGKSLVHWNDVITAIMKDKPAGFWALHVGKTWCLVVSVDDLNVPNVEPAVACALIVRPPKTFTMQYVPVELAGNRKVISGLQRAIATTNHNNYSSPMTSPPQVASSSVVDRWVSIDPVTCAPNLRRNECCLPPVALRLVDSAGLLSAPIAGSAEFQELLTDSYYAPRVELVLTEASKSDSGIIFSAETIAASKALLQCVRVVGGSFVFLDNVARGVTRHVVVEVSCSPHDLQHWASLSTNSAESVVGLVLQPHLNEAILSEGIHLPVTALLACLHLHDTVERNEVPSALKTFHSSPARRRLPNDHENHQNNDDAAPVAFSHRAHGQLPFLETQLRLIAAFAPNSLMVLHISAQWKLRLRDWGTLKKFNETVHPRTHINPTRLSVPPSRAAHVHACNFQFLLDAGISFSHVIIWASNELLVRAGIETYVKQFDMSHPGRVDPRDGVAHDNINIPLTWLHDEEHRRYSHRLWEFMPWDGVSQEPALAATFRRRFGGDNGTTNHHDRFGFPTTPRYPLHQVYLEGAFFSREVAREFVNVVSMLKPGTFCTTSGQYANNEIFPFLLSKYRCMGDDADASVQHSNLGPARDPILLNSFPPYAVGVSCGGRVSAMLWREFFYFGTPITLQETRCSPFSNPFGWKRVKKGLYPLTLELQEIAADPHRRLLNRDLPMHCNLTRESAAAYRVKQRKYVLSQL
ncbi:membrane-associated protein, putative [Bodo saltans]|uniref:Membrane-associated protein, putative n=1 Tax=Bodo saltans TaxID=75058 RepID=A0A0S4KLW2_BODSA|nr:membrane-associated protein, putative [Bodo saltans]|eukprot:CUI14607.1 membrane-associated protein, putative [Bodo saltans]